MLIRSNIYYPYYVWCTIPSTVGTQERAEYDFFLENGDLFTRKVKSIEDLGTKINGIWKCGEWLIGKEAHCQKEVSDSEDVLDSQRPRRKEKKYFIMFHDYAVANYILKIASRENLVIVKWIVIVNQSKIWMWK